MHNHGSDYLNVGECLSLTVVGTSIIMVKAVIHKPNTILKIRESVLLGFSIEFDLEQHRIIEIALIDAPTFQADEDINVQQENEFGSDIYREINSFKSLNELERHLESFLNKKIDSDRLEKVRVDQIADLRIEIHTNDHPPPHFHILGDGINASFSIEDGSLIAGHLNPTHSRRVRIGYKHSKSKLESVWNSTRPTNSSIGPISS